MNTREKIVEASGLRGRPVTLATGYFDPLLDWHAERLAAIRRNAETVVAVVLPLENELLPQRGRAELAAALRMIDYVLIAENQGPNTVESLVRALDPAGVFRLDEEELDRRGKLIAHVRSRQIR